MSSYLSDDDWRDLLREIHYRQVIPVIGPELVTLPDPNGNGQVPLYRALAPQLASRLRLPVRDATPISLNRVACEYLLSGGSRKSIYIEMSEILEKLAASPPPALCDLASITDFDLYLYGTIDSLLATALEKVRPGFRRQDHVICYDYKRPVDIPERMEPALVYQIVGSRQTYPNFAVWEEDYLECICGLTRHHAQLERLFLLLKTRYLLLLGAPFNDWIVRFFLFLVKGGRFTDRRKDDIQTYLADRPENLGEPLIFFFNQVVGTMRIIPGAPADFVRELTERWNKEYATTAASEDVLVQMPDEMPRGAVFISYSRDDKEAVGTLVRGLRPAQIPVWVDKQRLHAGENYQRNLEYAVKSGCSFFVSVISRASESDPTRFVHTERRWAAQRHVDGFVYYIPVVIDDTKEPTLEPPSFAKIHFERLIGGLVTPIFTDKLRKWTEEYRVAGQPRD